MALRPLVTAAAVLTLPLFAACASSGPSESPDGAVQLTPEAQDLLIEGRWRVDATLRAGRAQRDIHGILDFRPDGWVGWQPVPGPRSRFSECRYFARENWIEVGCPVQMQIRPTEDGGWVAELRGSVSERYYVQVCQEYRTNSSGQRVCVRTDTEERQRTVDARARADLVRAGG